MQAGLYIVGTPIGNLGDFSPRAIETLSNVDLIACEDTRVSGILAEKFGIKTKRISVFEHNEALEVPKLIEKMLNGAAIATISDAGMPGISDPGYRLTHAAREAGVKVFSVPGPTAFATAVAASGFPTDKFCFLGFLPSGESARQNALREMRRLPGTIIFYDSPNRIKDTIKDCADIIPERKIAVARELTKMFEEVVIGYPSEFPEFEARGEIVLLIEPAQKYQMSDTEIKTLVKDIVAAATNTKEAAGKIAEISGISKSDAYQKVLEVKNNGNS
jgi:16S rRNA (cytidine1402-2'-O)-methyltransferase